MKAEVHVHIQLGCDDLDRLGAAKDRLLPEGRVQDGNYEFRFRRGDPVISELLAILDREGVVYDAREIRSFRPREIADAVALHLAPQEQVVAKLDGGWEAPSFTGACEACGRGGEQVSDLIIQPSRSPHPKLAVTGTGHMLVSEDVARAMIATHISGCLLRGTKDPEGRPEDLFQVLPTHMLPPLCVPPTRIRHEPDAGCARCGTGALTVDSLLYYSLEEASLCDVNTCAEAGGLREGLAGGVVISQRLFRLLSDHQALAASVEPIVLV